jgi:hypothetical protein
MKMKKESTTTKLYLFSTAVLNAVVTSGTLHSANPLDNSPVTSGHTTERPQNTINNRDTIEQFARDNGLI